MTQTFYAGFGTTQPTFVGYIHDGKIFCSDAQGQQLIGVTSKVHDDLKSDYDSVYARCQEYYERLVKLGEITPELTGDALIKAQADELARATSLINQMSKNQDHLLSIIQNMARPDQSIEEEEHECVAPDTSVHSGDIPTMAGTDHRVQQSARPVQKHKARSSKGNSRQEHSA